MSSLSMAVNPYSDLPASAFWKTGVAQENPYSIRGIYTKKFDISAEDKIATAGSCFAQHISRHLKNNGYSVMDLEPAPPGLQELHQMFDFSMYSASMEIFILFVNCFSLRKSCRRMVTSKLYLGEDGKYFDALRPAIEPEGFDAADEVVEHRNIISIGLESYLKSRPIYFYSWFD